MGTLQLDVWRQTCIMGALKKILVIFLLNTAMVFALPKDLERQRKAIGIFNVIKFPNDPCIGSGTMNGTCYTADECSTRDGIASGSCADGYGVCCTITLSCGDTTTENCTYLMQASATSPNQDPPGSGVCEYTICPTTSSISRIRLDFTTFDIAGPEPIAAGGFAAIANTQDTNLAVGDCLTDVFTVSGAPQICGPNTGQHIILDTDSFEAAQDMGADGAKADVSEFGDGGAAGTGAGAAAAKYGMAPLGTIGFSLGYQLVAC